MSMELMVKAMKTRVGNPLRKLVLLKLADNANDQGECWPSYQYIADQCEISRSTVKNHIRELEKSGLLTREYRKNGTVNQSNVFHLTLDQSIQGVGQQMPGVGQPMSEVGQQVPEGGAADDLGGGAVDDPRTSHSLEPVNEPVIEPLSVPAKPKKPKPASAVPDEFVVDQRMLDWLDENQITTDWCTETNNFLDHHRAKGSKMVDWVASWRTWMRNSMKFARPGVQPPATPTAKAQVNDSLTNVHDTNW